MTALGRGGEEGSIAGGQEEVGCAGGSGRVAAPRGGRHGASAREADGCSSGAQMGNALLMAGKHRAAKAKKRWR